MSDNVIQFPKIRLDAAPQSPQEIEEKLLEYKRSYSDEIADILWQNVLGEMARSGCDFSKDLDGYFPSMILILESIRSLHLQTSGVEHPLQKFARETITLEQINEKMVDISDEME